MALNLLFPEGVPQPPLVPPQSLENPCYRRLVEEELRILFPEGIPQPPRPAPPPPDGGFVWRRGPGL